MSKRHSRHHKDSWPIWKISLLLAGGIIGGVGLLWLSLHMPVQEVKAAASAPASGPADPATTSTIGLTHIVLLFSLLCWSVAAVFMGWLIYRLYLRIPAWKRRQMFGRGK